MTRNLFHKEKSCKILLSKKTILNNGCKSVPIEPKVNLDVKQGILFQGFCPNSCKRVEVLQEKHTISLTFNKRAALFAFNYRSLSYQKKKKKTIGPWNLIM